MRSVSEVFKSHIHDTTRNFMFMKINVGLINQEAQNSASVVSEANELSNINIFRNNKVEIPYASYEQDFFRMDGSMIFPPKNMIPEYFNGLISKKVADNNCYLTNEFIEIQFSNDGMPLNIKGLSIRFYNFYPIRFNVEWGENVQTFDCNSAYFTTDFIFNNVVDKIKIVPIQMNTPYCRFRVENIEFGIGLEFTNNNILESTLETYVHPVSNTLSYKKLSFKVSDFKGEYDLENPMSNINFMELMQDINVSMGMQLPDNSIEWIKMESLKLAEWVSEMDSASFVANDLLSFNEKKYTKGKYYDEGITLYDLAISVLDDMGLSDEEYYIDAYLKTIKTKNPVPVCLHQEALQIIANAGHGYVSQDVNGKIFILNNFVPEYEINSNDKIYYANLKNVKDGNVLDYYSTFENMAMPVDGSVKNKPVIGPYGELYTGYVSEALSVQNGLFEKPQVINIKMVARTKIFGLYIKFGLTTCTKFSVKTYLENTLVETLEFNNDNRDFICNREWKEFDFLEISFISVKYENQRIYIDNINFGDITNYYISNSEFIDKTSKGKLNTVVKDFVVSTTSYAKIENEESLVDKDVTYSPGQEIETITFNDPVYGLRCEGAEVLDSSSYFVVIKKPICTTLTTSHITVFGYKYNTSTTDVAFHMNEKGIEQKFSNPLIDDSQKAYDLAQWIAEDYLRENKDYSFTWRGDLCIESNDIVYIENAFIPKMQLRIMKNTITFNGGVLKGSIEGRKVNLNG